MKTLILLIGTSAVGKSTIRQLLVPPPYKRWISNHENRLWEASESNGWAYLGRGKTGSEIIRSLGLFEIAINACFKQRDFVVVDTVRISSVWPDLIKRCLKRQEFKLFLVWFDLPMEACLKQLVDRRKKLNLHPFTSEIAIERQNKYKETTRKAVEAFAMSGLKYDMSKITLAQYYSADFAREIEMRVTK